MGLGSVIYALSKLDGELQNKKVKAVREVLANETYGDLAICCFFLRENFGYSTTEAYETGVQRMAGEGIEIDWETRKRFVTILLAVAKAQKGTSKTEWAFIRKFWRELLRMNTKEKTVRI